MKKIKEDLKFLNTKQREAVLSNSKRLLVLAGAGSGKTKTLLQKIIHLIENNSVKSSEILAVTFTKNAANEMIDRLIMRADKSRKYSEFLNNPKVNFYELNRIRYDYVRKYDWIKNLSISTFHAFCFKVLKNYGVNEFDNKFRVITDRKADDDEINKTLANETIYEVYHKLLIEKCNNDKEYLLDLKRYILDYFVDYKLRKNNDNFEYYEQYKRYSTLDGTKVRSKSEQFIADWLFRRNIKYQYEPRLNIKDFTFRPDFYIPAANVYIEHISNKSYPFYNKEVQFNKGNILFVKTFEEQAKDSALFSHILDNIIQNRLPENYQQNIKISYKEAFLGYEMSVREFLVQVIRVMDMIKVENLDFDKILKKARKDQHERVRNFFKLAIVLINIYNNYCIDKSYLDFNDMISRTISLFNNYPDILKIYKEKFNYLLVDEFQDVNNLQVELLKLLLKEDTQFFCVGDDWQSIYGFRGSNVNYIIDFEKHFTNSSVIKLSLNYRSTQNIVKASNEIIKNNKYKVDKILKASKKSANKIIVYSGNDLQENVEFAGDEIRKLYNEGFTKDDILFLYRRTKMYSIYANYFKKQELKVKAKTIHSAKGLESKVVFVVGLTDGYGGFPDIWLEDRIFQTIKKANHDLLLEEERRLFYVAITRAKDRLYLLSQKGNESRFINEIPKNYTLKTKMYIQSDEISFNMCPKCKTQIEKNYKFCPYCGNLIKK